MLLLLSLFWNVHCDLFEEDGILIDNHGDVKLVAGHYHVVITVPQPPPPELADMATRLLNAIGEVPDCNSCDADISNMDVLIWRNRVSHLLNVVYEAKTHLDTLVASAPSHDRRKRGVLRGIYDFLGIAS